MAAAPKKTISDLLPSLKRLKLAEARYALPASTPISAAAQHLLDERLTYVLVLDDLKASDAQKNFATSVTTSDVVGMLTERNVLQYAIDAGMLNFLSGRESQPPISRWMTPRPKMLSVRLDQSIEDALSTMHAGIWRHLPVLDYYNKLHSILDLRDVLLEKVGPDEREGVWKGCSALDILGAKRKSKIAAGESHWRDALSDYLKAHAKQHTITERATVEKAASQMAREQLTFLVVLDEQEKGVVGLVNERSYLSFATSGEYPDGSQEAVSGVMTPLAEVLHVSLTDPASHVVDVFFNHNVRHLPVIDHKQRLAGIISVRDLLRPLFS